MDINLINNLEKGVESAILRNAIMFLEKSILEIMPDDININEDNKIVFPIMHIQIAVELFLKYYVSRVYGFENILSKSQANKKNSNLEDYCNIINSSKIHTRGFSELIELLKSNKDQFAKIISKGTVVFFDLNISYFEDTFKNFQKIRNDAVHSACILTFDERKWIKSNFTVLVIFFIYTLLKRVKNFEYSLNPNLNAEECTLDQTPIEIFQCYLSSETVEVLKNSTHYIAEIEDVAGDIGQCYKCPECSKQALVLNADEEGWSKCFFCGSLFKAEYTDCPLCKVEESVCYDHNNIKINGNCMPAYCNSCEERMNVYKCPECDNSYAYDIDHDISSFHSECCLENFKPRYY